LSPSFFIRMADYYKGVDFGDTDEKTVAHELGTKKMRQFETGATRSAGDHKHDVEGFIAPSVLLGFCDYMHRHRTQRDGTIRDSDNWQKGIPQVQYLKSFVRHGLDFWWMMRGGTPLNPDDNNKPFTKLELAYALMFNLMGWIFEEQKRQKQAEKRVDFPG
jgi:hypothetical protein